MAAFICARQFSLVYTTVYIGRSDHDGNVRISLPRTLGLESVYEGFCRPLNQLLLRVRRAEGGGVFGDRFGWVPQAVKRGRGAGQRGESPQGGGRVWDDGSGFWTRGESCSSAKGARTSLLERDWPRGCRCARFSFVNTSTAFLLLRGPRGSDTRCHGVPPGPSY